MEEPGVQHQLLGDILAANGNAAAEMLIRTLTAFPDQLWVFNGSLIVVFCNEAAMQGVLGCEPGAILEDFPPGLQPLIKRGVSHCLEQHANVTIDEQVAVGKRGESRFSMVFVPLADGLAVCTIRELIGTGEVIESLRDREAKLSAVLDAIPDVMFRFNSDGVFIDCWAADASLLLMPPGEFIGHHVTERMPPQISQVTLDNIALTLTSGGLQSYEYSLTIGGQPTTWEARMVKSGPDEVLAIARDITKAKQAEMRSRQLTEELAQVNEELKATNEELEATIEEVNATNEELVATIQELNATNDELRDAQKELKESEKRFRDVVMSSADWVWEVDAQGIYTYASGRVLDVLGYRPEEIIGKTPFNLMPTDEARRIEEVFAGIAQRKEAIKDLENWNLAKDGSLVCLLTNGVPLLGEQGELTGYRGVDKDITARKQTEEALRESKKRYHTIAEDTPVLICRFISSGEITYVNETYCSYFAKTSEELVGTSFLSLIPEKARDGVMANILALTTESPTQSHEHQVITKSGDICWQRWTNRGLFDAQGNAVAFQAVGEDITERKLAEKALRESEERYRRVVENAREFIWQVDTEGRFVFFNHFAEKVSGQKSTDWQGKHFAPIIHTDELDYVMGIHEEVVAGRTVDYETRIFNDKGEVVDLEVQAMPIYAEGEVAGTLSFGRDITARKRAEDALRESAEKYRELVENMSEGMLLVDKNKNIQFANPAAERVFGVEPSCLVGRNWREFTTPQQFAAVSSQMDEQRAGCTGSYIIDIKRPDGTRRTLKVSASPRFDTEGNFRGSFGPVCDITEQVKLENHLHQSQKLEAIGALAGGIAHDFNNLLYAMLANTEIALSELPPDSDVRQSLVEVVHAGKHAKELVKQILSFARRSEPSPGPILATQVIKEVLSLLRASFPATIEIQHSIDSPPVLVLAGPTQIHQVLLNLCMNSRQALPEDSGVLKISVKQVEIGVEFQIPGTALPAGHYLSIEVQDNGCGVAADNLKRIFEPFFTTKGVGEGTGMGLAVVHGILSSLNGAITVESEVGSGSTFTIYLPVIEKASTSVQPASGYQALQGNEHILIVDDDEIIARASSKVLKRLGYRVSVLTNSHDALALIKEKSASFDLLVTDQTMPHLTGIELATEAKSAIPNLPIILCSGYSDVISSEDVTAYGVDEYLVKPFEAADLAAAIRRLLDQHKKPTTKAGDATP